jgi:hemolysin III
MEAPQQMNREVPLLRGLLHAVFCPVAMICGGVLAWLAPTPRAALALLIMSMGFAAVFGVSSVYHRFPWWSPRARRLARTADHSMIFLVMATTYTSVWLIALDGWISDAVLVYAWLAATIGVVSKLWFLDAAPSKHWISYMGLGLVGLVVIPSLWQTMGATGVGLMLLGGIVIALTSVAYVKGGPNPIPGWFGHHEIFHVGTIIGCALFLGALANFALKP